MMMNNFLLNNGGVANWISDSFPIIRGVLLGIVALACIVLIAAVLVSPPQTGVGRNAITGASESYYTKNKGANNQGRVRLLIIVSAITIAVCAILFGVTYSIYPAGPGA